MRTTIALDDELLADAQEYTGITEKSALVREALRALVEREAIKRLIALGGTDPDATAARAAAWTEVSAVLVDSSIWIDHLRRPEPALARAMNERRVLMHPFALAEIALGSLKHRVATIRGLRALQSPTAARHEEVMALIERERLHGLGIGYVDAHLLASALITPGATLWTRDKRLHAAAERLGVAAQAARA